MSFFDAFLAMDARLQRAGIPPVTAWWRGELERFYGNARGKLHLARVGRGGIKSTTSAKMLVAEVLFGGPWKVPPGERHWAINISENIDEARARLGQIEAYLDALGVRHERVGDQVTLLDRPLGFWSRAARIGAVSGPRVVAFAIDEAAKLDVEGANPAGELLTSLRAASVTHPKARGRMFSSPWGRADRHFDLVEAGETESHTVSIAPTWVANDTITEAETHALEPSLRAWSREFAAIPGATSGAALDADAVERAFKPRNLAGYTFAEPVICADPSSGRGDRWTWCVVRWAHQTPVRMNRHGVAMEPIPAPLPSLLVVSDVNAVEGDFWREVRGDDVVARVARTAEDVDARRVFADQREAFALEAMFRNHHLTYTSIAWTQPSKITAVERLRRWLAEGVLALPPYEKLRGELLALEERLTPNGSASYGARRGGHDDFAALLIVAAMVDLTASLPNSPLHRPVPRGMGRHSIGIL